MCCCNSVFLTKLLCGGRGWRTKEVQKLLFYEQYNILKMKTNTAIKYVPRNSYHSHALTSSAAIMIQAHQPWHAQGVVLCTTCKERTEFLEDLIQSSRGRLRRAVLLNTQKTYLQQTFASDANQNGTETGFVVRTL